MSSKRIKSNNSRQSAYITMKSSWSSKFLTPINDKAREIDDKFSEWQRLGTHRILYCIFDLQCIGAIPSQYIRNIFSWYTTEWDLLKDWIASTLRHVSSQLSLLFEGH